MFDPALKIEEVCSTDANRPVITKPWLVITETKTGRGRNRKTVRTAHVAATNSYVLARIKVEVDDDVEAGPLPIDAIQYARQKQADLHICADRVVVQNRAGTELATFPRHPDSGTFPDTDEIFKRATEPLASFGLNPTLLVKLATALGASDNGVRIDYYGPTVGLKITPLGSDNGEREGLIMPVKLKATP